jgi:hypothetical protein
MGEKGGMMVMAVCAGKHVTLFKRSRRAPGAGSRNVKDKFKAAAKATKGQNMTREQRNNAIAKAFGK